SMMISDITILLVYIYILYLTMILACKFLPITAIDMFFSIVQIVLIPIVLGIIIRIVFTKQVDKSVKALPLVSVVGIVAVAAAVVALNTEEIATTGLLIFSVVILHNLLGLLIGYVLAKLLRFDFTDQKAISIEVGMQNSGLGAALAVAHFSPIAAVPSALFSVWHNISGP